jgi:hypothetical protein
MGEDKILWRASWWKRTANKIFAVRFKFQFFSYFSFKFQWTFGSRGLYIVYICDPVQNVSPDYFKISWYRHIIQTLLAPSRKLTRIDWGSWLLATKAGRNDLISLFHHKIKI